MPSFRSLAQKAAQKAIEKQVGDLAETVTYHSVSATSYNATTGAPSRTETTKAVKAILTDYSTAERAASGGAIQARDRKATIASLSLGSSITPTPADRIVLADSTTWEVVSVTSDPAGAAWVFQIRRP